MNVLPLSLVGRVAPRRVGRVEEEREDRRRLDASPRRGDHVQDRARLVLVFHHRLVLCPSTCPADSEAVACCCSCSGDGEHPVDGSDGIHALVCRRHAGDVAVDPLAHGHPGVGVLRIVLEEGEPSKALDAHAVDGLHRSSCEQAAPPRHDREDVPFNPPKSLPRRSCPQRELGDGEPVGACEASGNDEEVAVDRKVLHASSCDSVPERQPLLPVEHGDAVEGPGAELVELTSDEDPALVRYDGANFPLQDAVDQAPPPAIPHDQPAALSRRSPQGEALGEGAAHQEALAVLGESFHLPVHPEAKGLDRGAVPHENMVDDD
mmetsp:Transcript_28448/g.64511  ORF Transcript_28448/g.64511 Transcript_28448/m.64511 type:complete len:321 (+) Transcript_28448:1117-2079(+)